jgi:plastocyanin
MNNKVFIGLIVLALGVLVGWYVFDGAPPTLTTLMPQKEQVSVQTPQLTPQASLSGESTQQMQKGGGAARIVVTYTDTGFAPVIATVRVGDIVTFVNESSTAMWVASAMHPTHQLLPSLDQKASVGSGGTYEYTFTNVGTWKYHNHVSPDDVGTVVVTQ